MLPAELSLHAPNIFPTLANNLRQGWRELFVRHPDRLVIGTDTYINLARTEDSEIAAVHRRWLAHLPRDIAEKIDGRNAGEFFSLPIQLFMSN